MARTPPRLSRELAAEILDRAARIDAADESFDLTSLRSAAVDAGSSQESFERALAEMVSSAREVESPAESQPNAYEVAYKAIGIGAICGTLAMVLVSVLLRSLDEMAIAGAVVGGGGALAGVIAYLVRKLKP